MKEDFGPDVANLRAPVLVILVLGIVAIQVVLFCVWRLVTMVRRRTVFSHAAFRYVHVVIGAIVAAALLMVLMVGGVGLAILGVALIVLVLRMLLAQAVARDARRRGCGPSWKG